MEKFATNYPDNGNINIVSHGNPTEVVDRITSDKRASINTAKKLINLINENYQTVSGDVESQESVIIQLFACSTGQDFNENTKSIAQIFSKGIPNAIIIAPNSNLVLKADGTVASMDGNKRVSLNIPWRVFHRGSEIKMGDIPAVKRMLSTERFFNKRLSKLLQQPNLKINPIILDK